MNSNAFGFNTTLMDYDDRLEIRGNGQTLSSISGFSRENLALQPDGTYSTSRAPAMAGRIGRLNQDGSSTLRDKNGTVRTFGPDGWIRSITDRNGNTVTIVRSGSQIQQIIEPGGRALSFQYGSGGISQITDPLGRTVNYTYEAPPAPFGFPQLRSMQNPAGGTTTYTYDGRYNLLTITDARGVGYLSNTYVTGTSNRPPDPAIATQTMADGAVHRLDYVVTNRSVSQVVVTDPRNHATIQRFTGRNHSAAASDALGQQTRITRDFTTNQVTEIRDHLNRLTKFTYDLAGNVNSVLDAQQNPTLFEYEPTFNRVTKITDALNQNTRFTYDPATGNLLATTDPLLHATSIAYNQFGQAISISDALNHATTFEYDDVGNLIVTTDSLGNRTLRFYDVVSRLIALVDPKGKSTQYTYDDLNRVTQIQDAINGVISFTYDPNGNLLTVTDGKNQTTTYTYDNKNRLATRKDALNRTESYQYDMAGNLTIFTDRKNQVRTFSYDSLNRRIGVSYADGSSTSFSYDTVGRLTKATDSIVGTIDFVYDNLDRLSKEISTQGVVEYTYDALGRRSTMKVNGAAPVSYQYDAASRLIQVAQAGLVVGLGYDNANRRTSLTYPNGTNASYTYDNASRLTNIVHNGPSGIIENLAYTYDAAGNRINLTRTNATATNLPAAIQAAYDAADEQIQFNSASPNQAFDANGNLTSDGANTYTWDARNRLIGMSGPSMNAAFSYDVFGRRIGKTVNGLTASYQYDYTDLVTEIGGAAVTARYLRDLNVDEAFVRQTTNLEYYHLDALKSSIALSDSSGIVGTTYNYEAFGRTTRVTGSSNNPFQYTGRENDETGLYFYRARYYSPIMARFLREDPIFAPYSPLEVGKCRGANTTVWMWPGMLLSKDPWITEKINPYAYAGDNPVRFADPSGLRCEQEFEKCRQKFKDRLYPDPDWEVPANELKRAIEDCRGDQRCLTSDRGSVEGWLTWAQGELGRKNKNTNIPLECIGDRSYFACAAYQH